MSLDFFLLFLFLFSSAFFSGSETALTTVSKAKVKNLARMGNKTAIILEKVLEKPGKLIASILVGNNFTNIAFTVISTTLFIRFLDGKNWLNAYSTFIMTFILSFLVLVFGEIIPKMIALSNADRFSFIVVRPIFLIKKVLSPFVVIINALGRFIVGIFGIKILDKGQFVTEEELKTLIDIGREEGVLEEDERQMLAGVFNLGDTVVREIMVPRIDMFSIDVNLSLNEIVNLVSEQGHSRVPVYEERIENVIGILYSKDLLKVAIGVENSIRGILRPAQFVPETKKIDDLLKKMRTKRSHIALVVDEHGGISGLVTIEDILEEIVGEINDEYDELEKPSLFAIGDYEYLVDASMNVYDLNKELNLKIPEDNDFDTLSGFVIHKLGEIPKAGEKVRFENLLFEVTKVKKNRIIELKLNIIEVEND